MVEDEEDVNTHEEDIGVAEQHKQGVREKIVIDKAYIR